MKAVVAVTVPPAAVTETFTVPGVPDGSFATIVVELVAVKEVALFVPKVTEATVVKPDPVMVIVVPPAVGPAAGVTLVMVGAAT